jgi:hypothetical protein
MTAAKRLAADGTLKHHTTTIDGCSVFYREAGAEDAPSFCSRTAIHPPRFNSET